MMINNPAHIEKLKALGFTYAVYVAKNITTNPVGTITAVFRHKSDANQSKVGLCNKFGKYTYGAKML